MKLLRTASSTRLLVLGVSLLVVLVGGAAFALAASGGSGPKPPAKPLAQALHDALGATQPQGIAARIKFTNNLFPSGALAGQVGSALMSGATGRLWVTNDGRGRLELQSNAGDVQVVWTKDLVTVYDASSKTVYSAKLPAQKVHASGADAHATGIPSVDEITTFLTKAADHAQVSGAEPDTVAGAAAYTVTVSPKHDGGLLGSAQLAWDAAHGTPLRVAVFAQGHTAPALALEATDISFGPVSNSDVDVAPPADTKKVDLSTGLGSNGKGADATKPTATGLDAVRVAAGFPVAAPATLVGLPRQDVRLVGAGDTKSALVLYGHGLGAIAVVERAQGAQAKQGMLGALPTISLDGVSAHELSTQLGTAIEWNRAQVSYVLAGSLPAAAAEAAARELK